MKKRKIIKFAIAIGMLLSAGITPVAFHLSSNDTYYVGVKGDNYFVSLDGSSNVLTNGSGTDYIHLMYGNSCQIDYTNYTHLDNNAWGYLGSEGYFILKDRIGGLVDILYSISDDLFVEYGYLEYDKPTHYHSLLSKENSLFTFPSEYGAPDCFKITNLNNDDVTIESLTFTYSCSQSDLHIHNGEEVALVDDEYGHICDICGYRYDTIDVEEYKIKLGSSSNDLIEYNPFNLEEYDGIGDLSFEYINDQHSFVLSLDGDHSGDNLYIDSNISGAENIFPRLTIKTSNEGAKLHDITFKGGYGVLIFENGPLDFINGAVYSEAKYLTVRSTLNFIDTRLTKDALRIDNGQLVIENDAQINITGYNKAISLLAKLTGTGGLNQRGGSIDISNTNIGVSIEYEDNLIFGGNTSMSVLQKAADIKNNVMVNFLSGNHLWSYGGSEDNKSSSLGIANTNNNGTITVNKDAVVTISDFRRCIYGTGAVATVKVLGILNLYGFYPIYETSIVVGEDDIGGRLFINVDASGSTSDKKATGITQNRYESCRFRKGQVIIISNTWSYTTGISLKDGYIRTRSGDTFSARVTVESGCDFGLKGIRNAMDTTGYVNDNGELSPYYGTFDTIDTIYTYAVSDLCYYSANKPNNNNFSTESDFDNKFAL